jgi:hypothetical protein
MWFSQKSLSRTTIKFSNPNEIQYVKELCALALLLEHWSKKPIQGINQGVYQWIGR